MSRLFTPKPPLRFIEQLDVHPKARSTHHITGIASYLKQLQEYTAPESAPTPSLMDEQSEARELAKAEKKLANIKKLDEDFHKWKPDADPNIKGDPFKTVFIARLDYETDEVELQKEFSKFGEVERLRIVRDKDGKSKGYAFVTFTSEHSARAASKEASGMKLRGRSILTDIERARTIKNWVPRRLGGGLGGRHYILKQKQKEALEKKKAEMYGGRMGAPRRFPGRGRGGNERPFEARGDRPYESKERPYEARPERLYESRGDRGPPRGYEPRSSRKYEPRSEKPYESRSERTFESRNEKTDRSSIGYNSRGSDRYSSRSERNERPSDRDRERDRYRENKMEDRR